MSKVKRTKEEKAALVKKHFLQKKKLTSWQAINLYGVTRLAAYVFRLKKHGLDIVNVESSPKPAVYIYTPPKK